MPTKKLNIFKFLVSTDDGINFGKASAHIILIIQFYILPYLNMANLFTNKDDQNTTKDNIKVFYKAQEAIIKLFDDYFEIVNMERLNMHHFMPKDSKY